MANYNLVINSKFRPFSYAEMLAPVQAMTEQYLKTQEQFSDLMTKASVWENMANQQSDPQAYAMYKSYASALQLAADDLNRNGVTAQSLPDLMALKAGYASHIEPIKTAYDRREKLAAEQRQLKASGKNYRFDNDFSTISLDKLIQNPSISYDQLASEDISNMARVMASDYAKYIQSDPQYQKILGGQYWQAKIQKGYSPEQIIAEATGSSDAPEPLKRIRQSIHNQLRERSAYDKDFVDNAISMGMSSAVGSVDYDTKTNQDYMSPAERTRLSMAIAEHNWKLADRAPVEMEIPTEDGKTEKVWYDPVKGSTFKNEGGRRIYTPYKKTGGEKDKGKSEDSDWVPEVINGVYTGRMVDAKTGTKIKDALGNRVTGKISDKKAQEIVKPIFFTAGSGGGRIRYEETNGPTGRSTGFFGIHDPRRINYSELTGKEAKNAVSSYIKKVLGLPITLVLGDDIIKEASKEIEIIRDRDWWSDNHFEIRLPGVSDDGEIRDPEEYTKALSNLRSKVLPNSAVANALPAD